jgi:hypothetical protein
VEAATGNSLGDETAAGSEHPTGCVAADSTAAVGDTGDADEGEVGEAGELTAAVGDVGEILAGLVTVVGGFGPDPKHWSQTRCLSDL